MLRGNEREQLTNWRTAVWLIQITCPSDKPSNDYKQYVRTRGSWQDKGRAGPRETKHQRDNV